MPPENHDHLVIEPRPYDDPDVSRMIAAVQAEYVEMYGGPDAAAVDPDEFAPPDGLLLVGLLNGEAVAMGGWRLLGGGRAELKRMYVVRRARRQGLSRLILAEIERTAAAAGVHELILNTGPVQREAIALYLSSGYTDVTPFGHYVDYAGAMFYGKVLPAGVHRADA